jgi:acyl-CoA thioesterase I
MLIPFVMRPIFLFLASGDSLYAGAALLLLAIVASRRSASRWSQLSRRLISWCALAMMIMASPPFAWVIDALFLAVFATWMITSNELNSGWKLRIHTAAALALITFSVVLPAMEFSHRSMPVIKGGPEDHILVLGDSISSGIGSRVVTWPAVLQQTTGVLVNNLALPGATTADGKAMARKVKPADHIILIELGGNDLLAGISSNVFADNLEALLSQVSEPGRTVVMFELPLLPQQVEYGRIQRHLAGKYHVSLIPKRFLTEVLGGPNATLDGLHLSDIGARHMAAVVARALAPVLKANLAAKHSD